VVPVSFATAVDHRAGASTFRVARGVKYTLCCLSAIMSAFYPSSVLADAFNAYSLFAYAWSAMLFMGAVTSLIGIVSRTWVGEYIGLWGVIASLMLYSLSCFATFHDATGNGRIFLGFLIAAFAMSTFARHQDVVFQKRVADYERRVREGKAGL
jgi:O-antigen/teichoic acid export membrane protein